MAAEEQGMSDVSHMRLLLAVAEQLKVPLTIIGCQAELAELDPAVAIDPAIIRQQSNAALLLVDNYLMGLQLLAQQTELQLEPVSVSSTVVDAAHTIAAYARCYDVRVELDIAGRYGPVMAHHAGLRAALLSLGFALVESASSQEPGRRLLKLAAHRTPKGIVTGWYGTAPISPEVWRRAVGLHGNAQQPLPISGGSAAGMFVADALSKAMDTVLRVGHRGGQTGFAMTLQPSQQLQFI